MKKMNREIKFRAWNVNTKRMAEWEEVREEYGFKYLLDNEITIPMQCTGLKDKNGKEIYEGDFYKTIAGKTPNGEAKEIIYRVVFNHGAFVLYVPGGNKQGDRYLGSKVNMLNGEVIGNIYENPELLTQHKEETK